MALSADLAAKSVQAAIAAIEVYNKPDFSYREEAFSLLMTNAWELLIKAKWILDHGEAADALYLVVADSTGKQAFKRNRSGNPLSFGLIYLAAKLLEDKNSGLEQGCHDNILALVEIRDNAAHLLNKDLFIGRRILEIGTASLRNYLLLGTEWFQLDLRRYNFFLMPISFYHGFESAEPALGIQYPEQVKKLLDFIAALEEKQGGGDGRQPVALRLETKFVRGKDAGAVAYRLTDDPKAPAIAIREEDILKNYPMAFKDLVDTMKRRYENFLQNSEFHGLLKPLAKERKFALVRLLNPNKPGSSKQVFYNANILQEFDKHYKLRKKA
jgi:hypothetical protein